MDMTELNKILKYIEENIRVTDQTTIEYLDPRGHIERLNSKQNHVIFGRRGSGKSLLLKSIKEKNNSAICLKANLEDFKDISFPDSIIQILRTLLEQLNNEIANKYSIWSFKKWRNGKKISKELNEIINTLTNRLQNPDDYDEAIKSKRGSKTSGKAELKNKSATAAAAIEKTEELEVSKSIKIDKLNILKNELPDFKDLINKASDFLEKPLFLILDDFYFIRRTDQPYLIDFFHRLSKNTNLYLKVATIKHRSSLYLQGETYIGIEMNHDAQALNLDYSLENFDALLTFTKALMNHVKEKANSTLDVSELLTDNAFKFLCLASGGVPRDFFSLFIGLGNKIIDGKSSISKPDVIEIAIENLPNKLDAFKTDSAEEKEILDHYLQFITEEIINGKRTNSFLVSNTDIAKYSQINQALKELVDLRLLHIVNSNISSAPSDGKRYTAYMIDIGLYPNSRPREFKQIEPGEKDAEGREDKIRSAPKINLDNYKKYIDNLSLTKKLTETEY